MDTIVRACHLMPVDNKTGIPIRFHYGDSLHAFRCYYINWFIDSNYPHKTVV